MISADLPSYLFSGVPAIYCVGLALGFDSLLQRRVCPERQSMPRCAIDRFDQTEALFSSRTQGLQVSIVHSPEAIAEAARLVDRRYSSRGYALEASDNHPRSEKPAELHGITFLARDDEAAIGTLTLRLDGPLGLRAEEGYAETISAVRADGRHVCELTRLALAESTDSKAVLASLFSLAYAVGRSIHGVTDVFIEVNPRHVGFYRRMLGFVVAAGERFCERVKAPSVLLKLEVADFERRLLRLVEPWASDSTEQTVTPCGRD